MSLLRSGKPDTSGAENLTTPERKPDNSGAKTQHPRSENLTTPETKNELHRLVRLRLLCCFLGFQLGQLLFGLHFAGLIPKGRQPRIE
jgi:hypothetical protein